MKNEGYKRKGKSIVKQVIDVKQVPAAGPYSQAVEAGGFVFCSGQIPIDPGTGRLVESGIGDATRQVMRNLAVVLGEAGLSLKDVVKTTIYLVNLDDFATVNEIYGSFFDGAFPARSTVQVAALPKGAPIELDAVAVRP